MAGASRIGGAAHSVLGPGVVGAIGALERGFLGSWLLLPVVANVVGVSGATLLVLDVTAANTVEFLECKSSGSE